MIYLLLKPFVASSHIANLFHYISFRSILSLLVSLIICFSLGPKIINLIKKWQKEGQPIRDDGPKTHISKAGTPTMGGLMVILSVTISILLFSDLTNLYVLSVLFILLGYGAIGFYDDYMKVKFRNSKGLSARKKLLYQLLIALPCCLLISYVTNKDIASQLNFPYLKNIILDLGFFYIPFSCIVIIGASNAVNLTDGLDGLAILPIAIAAGCYGIISYLVGNAIYSNYLQIFYIPGAGEITIICASLIGGSLGFLWFNSQPAEIFMGDVGSLALGGVLGIISVITKHEITLAIVGGLFVAETLSVIIQVYYFKATKGKRFFKMAPLHHHYEHLGWSESKVVIRFWIVAVIFALIGLTSLKLR